MKHILNSKWKSSNFYVLPKVHKSKKIIEKLIKVTYLCKYGTTRGFERKTISGISEKLLTPLVSSLKTYVNDDWDFIRKLPSHIDYSYVLPSCVVVRLYASIHHNLGLETLS